MANSTTYALPDPEAIAAKIKQMGGPALDPTQPTGKSCADAVCLGWEIAEGKITVTILSKPWILPASTVWEHVDAIFKL